MVDFGRVRSGKSIFFFLFGGFSLYSPFNHFLCRIPSRCHLSLTALVHGSYPHPTPRFTLLTPSLPIRRERGSWGRMDARDEWMPVNRGGVRPELMWPSGKVSSTRSGTPMSGGPFVDEHRHHHGPQADTAVTQTFDHDDLLCANIIASGLLKATPAIPKKCGRTVSGVSPSPAGT